MAPSLRLTMRDSPAAESRELRRRKSQQQLEPDSAPLTRKGSSSAGVDAQANGHANGRRASGNSQLHIEPSSEDLGGYFEDAPVNGRRAPDANADDADADGEPDTLPNSEAVEPAAAAPTKSYYLEDDDEDDDPIPVSKKGKGKAKAKEDSESEYADEPDAVEDDFAPSDDADATYGKAKKKRFSVAPTRAPPTRGRSRFVQNNSSDEDEKPIRTRKRVNKQMRGFVEDEEDDDDILDLEATYNPAPKPPVDPEVARRRREAKMKELETKRLRKLAEAEAGENGSQAPSVTLTTGPSKPKPRQTRNSLAALDDDEYSDDDSQDIRKYSLRDKRREVNYDVAAQFSRFGVVTEEARERHKQAKAKAKSRSRIDRGDGTSGMNGLPFSMTGAQLSRIFGEQDGDSSDSDRGPGTGTTPRKSGAARLFGTGMLPSGGGLYAGPPGLMNDMGGPSNLGRVSGTNNLADIDPLLPASTISFDKVGGLDAHIQQLKEMVALPLLYPEVFQRFNITPPRGVLFHGPPGTGKTLLARALAASCSTDNQRIAFFMRKGADCLSKWVGEAERQLRLLFEEAKNSQPSIIFFDEIDGLAPVRSSKQEQIHASIVSTLLALMDGMDGRGQVIVIGATNRPDAIDPALRRPGRFDREFYFPLPNRDARRKILDIHTSGWEPPLQEDFKDELATMTKGYGGADLRALCTEAALNAVQRRYPQIYKSNDRLLIEPETIEVSARDFVLSAKKLIPSTARSTSSVAIQLPAHFVPVLGNALEHAKATLAKILPEVKRIDVLEEADEEPSNAGFEQEKIVQNFERLRVFKPRLLVCGEPGLGQTTLGPAILHHLEGFHVQSLDLGTLVSDSTRSLEAACVQIFTEARRHKPSIIYIPSLLAWTGAVTDSVKATVQGLLDAIDPSDPILLLAVVEGPFRDLPADIRSWFGFLKQNRIVLEKPSSDQRRAFFDDLLASVRRPPNEYPDALPKRKRVLPDLPKAPPPKPREMTQVELQQQMQQDTRVREYLKFRLAPVLTELRKRYKKFVKPIGEPGLTPAEIDARPKPRKPEGMLSDVEELMRRPNAYGQVEDDEESLDFDAMDVQDEPDAPTPQSEEDVVIAPLADEPAPAPSEPDVEPEAAAAPIEEPASVPQTNGDVSMAEPPAAEPVEEAQPAVTEPVADAAQPPPSDAIDVDAQPELPVPAPAPTLMPGRRFHDIDLEQMQHNLYYDNYLTPDDFIADLALILENAELDGEGEQLGRAFAMLNHARVLLDQAFDINFKLECQRMAHRQQQRNANAKGKGPEFVPAIQDDTVKEAETSTERPLKRGRSDEPVDGVMGEDEEARKRAKITEAEVLEGDGNFEAGVADNALMPGVAGEVDRPVMGADLGILPEPEQPQQPLKEPTPPPAEPSPPFVVPPLDALAQSLEFDTDGLNLDALDQLRAACYDLVWHARSHWDRTSLVADLRDLVVDFTDEAKAAMLEVD